MPILGAKLSSDEQKSLKQYHDLGRIYIAEIMDSRTPLYNGDLMVWVRNSGTSKDNPKNWVIAHCANNMFGHTVHETLTLNSEFKNQQTSYGWWNPTPYVGNLVFIFYPVGYGESSNPYWFGTPMENNNVMLPGIPFELEQRTEELDYTPKCEVNYHSAEVSKRQEYPHLKNALQKQGLDKDLLRGISTASSFRETPSMCYGFLSPLGNQFVIDDGWSNGDQNLNWDVDPRPNNTSNSNKDDYGLYHNKKEWKSELNESSVEDKLNRFHGGFRFRTRNGTQLLILDTGNIYMINKDGSAWMELSDDGYIDCYSEKGVNVSSDGDINLYSKKNINIHAEDTISLKSQNMSIDVIGNVNTQCGSLNVSNEISVPMVKADQIHAGLLTSKNAQLNGAFQGTLNGTAFRATIAGVTPEPQPIPIINQVEVNSPIISDVVSVEQMVGSKPIPSIATRIPTHEPYAGHDKNKFIPKMISRLFRKRKEENKQVEMKRTNTI